MHHLVQHGKVRSQMINVPEGLPELLSDITREVLRCQPITQCLCQFIIDYLQSVIATRDKARVAKSIIDRALRTVDEIIADMCICNISQTKADQMSEVMEECFRRFLAQRRCERGREREIVKFNEFDMLDELIQKCKFSEDELKISKPIIEVAYQKFVEAYMTAQQNTEGTESLYQYFREREIKRMKERVQAEAAVKIQSTVRGFLVRRSMFMDKSQIPTNVPSPVPSETKNDLVQREQAARKIQRFYRRRKSIAKLQLNNKEEKLQELCDPTSIVSLSSHPANHHKSEEGQTHDEGNYDNYNEILQHNVYQYEDLPNGGKPLDDGYGKIQNYHHEDIITVDEDEVEEEQTSDEFIDHEESPVE